MESIEIFSYSIKYRTEFPFSPRVPNFSFDCRGVSNPGRVPGFMALTGLNAEVIDFLDRDTGAGQLLSRSSGLLIDYFSQTSRKTYGGSIIGFACTGGRHRSVYFAERAAALLRHGFPERTVTVSHLDIASNFVPGCLFPP